MLWNYWCQRGRKINVSKILSGTQEATSGHVHFEPGKHMSVLEQNHNLYDSHTVLETVLMGNKPLFAIKSEIDALYNDYNDANADRIEITSAFEEMDGWNADGNCCCILANLGIKEELHYTFMADLDGKQKVRVLLAQALLDRLMCLLWMNLPMIWLTKLLG